MKNIMYLSNYFHKNLFLVTHHNQTEPRAFTDFHLGSKKKAKFVNQSRVYS